MSQQFTIMNASTGLKRFEKLQHQRCRALSHLNFLMECKRKKLTPKFINVTCGPKSKRIGQTLQRCAFSILRTVIKDTRSKIARIEHELYFLYSELANLLDPILWDMFLSRILNQIHYESIKLHSKHKLKLDKVLSNKQQKLPVKPIELNSPIVNLSGHDLTTEETNVISLGLNFSVASRIDPKKIIIDTETILSTVVKESKHSEKSKCETTTSRTTTNAGEIKSTTTNGGIIIPVGPINTASETTTISNSMVNIRTTTTTSGVSTTRTTTSDGNGGTNTVTPVGNLNCRTIATTRVTSSGTSGPTSKTDTNEIRYGVSKLVSNHHLTPYVNNLSSIDRDTLKSLKDNEDILIMQADKGGQIAIVDRIDYDTKVQSMLNDDPSYETCNKDYSSKYLQDVRQAIAKSKFLSPSEKWKCIPSNAIPAKLYALPKVHKAGNPYRPIVSCIGTATYSLAQCLAKKLSFLNSYNVHTVKNSETLISKLKERTINDKTILVSFDVKSMFTKIPLHGAILTLERRLCEAQLDTGTVKDAIDLVKICTNSAQFSFNDRLYKQVEGLAMGNPLSPLLSDTYMHYFEHDMLESAPSDLTMWLRYVDDVFSLWEGSLSVLTLFLDHLNSLDPHLQFTIETNNKSLPFLDVLITKDQEFFVFSVYRKPFAVSLPIHRMSAHPWSQKMSAFYYFVRRALLVCSNMESLNDEINYLKNVAVARGYNPSIIDTAISKIRNKINNRSNTVSSLTPIKEKSKYASFIFYPQISPKISTVLNKINVTTAFKPAKTLSNVLTNLKDKTPVPQQWGIYQIDCGHCDLSYIGQTKRSLKIRADEHRGHTRRGEIEKSAIAKHSHDTGHSFKFNDVRLLFKPKLSSQLDVSETIFIKLHQDKLVNNNIMPFLHNCWNNIVAREREKLST